MAASDLACAGVEEPSKHRPAVWIVVLSMERIHRIVLTAALANLNLRRDA
jgi:hypothetical protein